MKSKTKQIIHKRLLDLKETAEYLGRSVCSVRELIWAGKLPYVKFDRKLSVDINDLEKFVDQNKGRYTF